MFHIQDAITYRLINDNTEPHAYTELDLDEREVGSAPYSGDLYQEWVFIRIRDKVFHIQSVKNNKFLAPSVLAPGNQLIVREDYKQEWLVKDVSRVEHTVRISPVERTDLCVGLRGGGGPPGTPVQLEKCESTHKNQVWRMQKVY